MPYKLSTNASIVLGITTDQSRSHGSIHVLPLECQRSQSRTNLRRWRVQETMERYRLKGKSLREGGRLQGGETSDDRRIGGWRTGQGGERGGALLGQAFRRRRLIQVCCRIRAASPASRTLLYTLSTQDLTGFEHAAASETSCCVIADIILHPWCQLTQYPLPHIHRQG